MFLKFDMPMFLLKKATLVKISKNRAQDLSILRFV